jgi:hypothetical protein
MSRQAGSIVRGKAAPEIRQSGPAAGGGYVLRRGLKVKARGNRSCPAFDRCARWNPPTSWQEWQSRIKLIPSMACQKWATEKPPLKPSNPKRLAHFRCTAALFCRLNRLGLFQPLKQLSCKHLAEHLF